MRLNRFLTDNDCDAGPEQCFWLADTYDSLQHLDECGSEVTAAPVDADWQSPWVGTSVDEVVAFMTGLPECHVRIDRKHFVGINHTLEDNGTVWCYRIERQSDSVKLKDAPDAKSGRLEYTRFACKATEAAEILFSLLSRDWERHLCSTPPRLNHSDADSWTKAGKEDIEHEF